MVLILEGIKQTAGFGRLCAPGLRIGKSARRPGDCATSGIMIIIIIIITIIMIMPTITSTIIITFMFSITITIMLIVIIVNNGEASPAGPRTSSGRAAARPARS